MKIDLISQYNLMSNKSYPYYNAANNQQSTAILATPKSDQLQPQQIQASTALAQPAIQATNKMLMAAGAIISSITAAILLKNTKGISEASETLQKFADDIPYKKNILTAMGIDAERHADLTSVVGKHEFLTILSDLQEKPEMFSVGGELFDNVRKKVFGANMHIHTRNSDGKMFVSQLLDMASRYADKFAEKNNRPFVIGITDHDTVNGCIEAVKLILKDPAKYKNLKLVLGTETKVLFSSKYGAKAREVDLLSYCINPFNPAIANLNKKQLLHYQDNIRSAISNANKTFKGTLDKYKLSFSFDEMAKVRPSVLVSPCSVNYSIKDYMQFRLLYADAVENNPRLVSFLKENNTNISDLDFSIPALKIRDEIKEPYWQNYIVETKKYLKEIISQNNPQADTSKVDSYFKNPNASLKKILGEIASETQNPKSGLFIKKAENISFDETLHAYSQMNESVSGIAHPCIPLSQEIEDGNKNAKLYLDDLFSQFKNKVKQKQIIYEGYYQTYWENTKQEWKDYAIELGTKHSFIKSGGLDSHYDNIFTDQSFLPKELIEDLIYT